MNSLTLEQIDAVIAEKNALLAEQGRIRVEELNIKKQKIVEQQQFISKLQREVEDEEEELMKRGLISRPVAPLMSQSGRGKGNFKKPGERCEDYCLEVFKRTGRPMHHNEIEAMVKKDHPDVKYAPDTYRETCRNMAKNGLLKKTAGRGGTWQLNDQNRPVASETIGSLLRHIINGKPNEPWNPELLKKELEIQFNTTVSVEEVERLCKELGLNES